MTSERIKALTVVLPTGVTLPGKLRFTATPPWVIVFDSDLAPAMRHEGEDLFECLVGLRHALEEIGVKILCAGARRDVYPSGMSRQMAGGRIAYKLRIGEPATNRVDIFDVVEGDGVATVEEQREYYKTWQESILSRSR
jgi:hypothetical protein